MMSRSSLCLFPALVVRPLFAVDARKGTLVGGWSPNPIKYLSTVKMMSRSSLCLFPALAVLPLFAVDARKGTFVGGWSPIKDLSDPHVKEIAEFAVAEYNKQSKAALKLQSVVRGETQVVSGMNYRLVVAAKDGGRYEAVVHEKLWAHYRNLTSFKPVNA